MGTYSLTNSINNICGGVTKSYICNGFVKNPIIAGMVVTFITILIIYISKTNNLTKIFVTAALCNIVYLFFHTHAITESIGGKQSSNNLVTEFTNIKTQVAGGDVFSPPED